MKSLMNIEQRIAQRIAELYGKKFSTFTVDAPNESVKIVMDADNDPNSAQDLTIFSTGFMEWLDQDNGPVIFNTLLAIDFLRKAGYYLGPKEEAPLPQLTLPHMQEVLELAGITTALAVAQASDRIGNPFNKRGYAIYLENGEQPNDFLCEQKALFIAENEEVFLCTRNSPNEGIVPIEEAKATAIVRYLKEQGYTFSKQ